eukprot:TRINITY_DN5910_c0_g2_i3.p1 TRINITY_DN5910_c0_g2~~TRINITY_DN5910_c0_g2_i3.p1  ORF type:complete len:565 (-),score=119.44 TRINITY_DN5910_c0_g2_i3:141-1835(-)
MLQNNWLQYGPINFYGLSNITLRAATWSTVRAEIRIDSIYGEVIASTELPSSSGSYTDFSFNVADTNDWLSIDLRYATNVTAIKLYTNNTEHFIRKWIVGASISGKTWGSPFRVISSGVNPTPGPNPTVISFPSIRARYLKIYSVGESTSVWGVSDLQVLDKDGKELNRAGWVLNTSSPLSRMSLSQAIDDSPTSTWGTTTHQQPGYRNVFLTFRYEAPVGVLQSPPNPLIKLNTFSFNGGGVKVPDCSWVFPDWESCTSVCASGKTERSRTAYIEFTPCVGGDSPAPTETESCGCNVECQFSDWTPWTECPSPCGPATRVRYPLVEPCVNSNNSATIESKSCPTSCGTSTCLWQWASWSACTVTCGGGTRTRTAQPTNLPCDDFQHPPSSTQSCSTNICDGGLPDCSWEWPTTWGDCIGSCGITGKQNKTAFTINSPCIGEETKPFITQDCYKPCLNCSWSEWGSWSTCSKSCGGGFHTRSKSALNPNECTTKAPTQTIVCSTNDCPEPDSFTVPETGTSFIWLYAAIGLVVLLVAIVLVIGVICIVKKTQKKKEDQMMMLAL